MDDAASIRRFAGIALVTGLSTAAAAAVLALLTGDFDDTDLRVILTSIGFALSSAVGSTGAAARLRPSERLQVLGTITLGAAVGAFCLLLVGLWTDMDSWGAEGVWRAFGVVAMIGIAGSHACALLGAERRTDTGAIRLLTRVAVALATIDSVAVILQLVEIAEGFEDPWPRIFGATLVLLVLASILPAILRKMQGSTPAPDKTVPAASHNGNAAESDEFLADAVIRVADRIAVLNADPGNRSPEIRAELDRLRQLARTFQS